MRNLVIGCAVFLSAAMVSSCQKPGCMDKTALNYNPNATGERGVQCLYIADSLVGNFNGPDTIAKRIVGDTFQYSYGHMGFSFARTPTSDILTFKSFFVYEAWWRIDSIPFARTDWTDIPPTVVNSSGISTDSMHSMFSLNNDTIFYYIVFTNDSGVYEKCWGYGIR